MSPKTEDDELLRHVAKGRVRIVIVSGSKQTEELLIPRASYFVGGEKEWKARFETEAGKLLKPDGEAKDVDVSLEGYSFWYRRRGWKAYFYVNWQSPVGVVLDQIALLQSPGKTMEFPVELEIEKLSKMQEKGVQSEFAVPYDGVSNPMRDAYKQSCHLRGVNNKSSMQDAANRAASHASYTLHQVSWKNDASGSICVMLHMLVPKEDLVSSVQGPYAMSTLYRRKIGTETLAEFLNYSSFSYAQTTESRSSSASLEGKVLIQGITPDADSPLAWLYDVFKHPDGILHISAIKR